MDYFDLAGRRVIVTGGSRGVGKELVRGFLRAGCSVATVGSSERIFQTAEQCAADGYADCHPVRADLGKPDEVQRAFAGCLDGLGGDLDVVVNNAAITYRSPPDEIPLGELQRLVDTNVVNYYLMTQLATSVMKKKGKGRVINVSSTVAFFGGVGIAAYSATKGAILQLTRSFSNDCAKYGITYNCVAPGYTETDFIAGIDQRRREEEILPRHPMGRIAVPKDIVGACLFLASDEAAFITGVYLNVDGGYLAMS